MLDLTDQKLFQPVFSLITADTFVHIVFTGSSCLSVSKFDLQKILPFNMLQPCILLTPNEYEIWSFVVVLRCFELLLLVFESESIYGKHFPL